MKGRLSMIKLFFICLTIFSLSYARTGISETSKTNNECSKKIFQHLNFYDYPNAESMSRSERHCLSVALLKHFKIGWRSPVMSPTPKEREWYNNEWKAFRKGEMSIERFTEFNNTTLFLKIEFVDEIDAIIAILNALTILSANNNTPENYEKNYWGNFFAATSKINLISSRNKLIERNVIKQKGNTINGRLACEIAPTCWPHLILPGSLKAIF